MNPLRLIGLLPARIGRLTELRQLDEFAVTGNTAGNAGRISFIVNIPNPFDFIFQVIVDTDIAIVGAAVAHIGIGSLQVQAMERAVTTCKNEIAPAVT